jgi:hypothetical protein
MILILLVFAFVFFCIGTFYGPNAPAPATWYGRFNVVSAGLAAWVLTEILIRTNAAHSSSRGNSGGVPS